MRDGVVLSTSDRGITLAEAARAAEAGGFEIVRNGAQAHPHPGPS